jgi:hypothetical protein
MDCARTGKDKAILHRPSIAEQLFIFDRLARVNEPLTMLQAPGLKRFPEERPR